MQPPVELGTLLFTSIEPHRGHEVDYNRWYENDHFYAGCMVGEYQFAGRRFVATKRLKALREQTPSPMCEDPMSASYLSIYWVLKGFHKPWTKWAVDTVKELHAQGRMFPERDHIHTALYRHEASLKADERGTSIELALDRDYAGLVVTAGDLTGDATIEQLTEWTDETWAPAAKAAGWGPDLIGTSSMLPLPSDAPDVPIQGRNDTRFLQLHFLTRDPEDSWAEGYANWGAELRESGLATPVWTAPYIPTVMGTDMYTDQLW